MKFNKPETKHSSFRNKSFGFFVSFLEFMMIFFLEWRHTDITTSDAELVFVTNVWNILGVAEMWCLLSQEGHELH